MYVIPPKHSWKESTWYVYNLLQLEDLEKEEHCVDAWVCLGESQTMHT